MNNVRNIIKELAKDKFRWYPNDYFLNPNGFASDEVIVNVHELAISYYNHRNEHEIDRDAKQGITQIDYIDFCMDAFSEYINIK